MNMFIYQATGKHSLTHTTRTRLSVYSEVGATFSKVTEQMRRARHFTQNQVGGCRLVNTTVRCC